MHWDNYGWGMGIGWILMVLFWLFVIVGIVYLVQAGISRGKPRGEDPLDILKRRYAKGEISREEFERMKDDLKKE